MTEIEQLKEALLMWPAGIDAKTVIDWFETYGNLLQDVAAEYARMQWRDDMENAPKNERILVATDHDIYAVNWVKNPFTDHEAWLIATYDEEGHQALINTENIRFWQPITTPKEAGE